MRSNSTFTRIVASGGSTCLGETQAPSPQPAVPPCSRIHQSKVRHVNGTRLKPRGSRLELRKLEQIADHRVHAPAVPVDDVNELGGGLGVGVRIDRALAFRWPPVSRSTASAARATRWPRGPP